METSSHQSHQPPYQKSPCPPKPRIDILPDIEHTNDIGCINSSPRFRPLHHSLSYPPASGRPLHRHVPPKDKLQSHLQTGTSPPGTLSSSPELPTISLSTASSPIARLSSFPLPYRSQSAARYGSPPSQYASTTFPLTSQDPYRPYYSSPTPALPGRFSSPNHHSHIQTSSSGFSTSYGSQPSREDISPFSSPDWQTRDSKWPQSRTQSSRKYIPKSRRYDSPINQRRVAPRNGFAHPAKKYSLPGSIQARERRHPDGQKRRNTELVNTRSSDEKATTERPRLMHHALPANLEYGEETKNCNTPGTPTSVSRYISPADKEDSVKSIRNSQYWTQLQHDPIFSDLSTTSETISITDLKQRRDHILQNHAPPRQAIMKEQGTQTDPEEGLPFMRPRTPPLNSSSTTPTEQSHPEQMFIAPRPKSVPHSQKRPQPKERRNQHSRTASLTDTDTPRISVQQLNGRPRGFKRSRSVAEEDYEESDYSHRRKVGGGISQGSFYRYLAP